jgi:hypothetical protein
MLLITQMLAPLPDDLPFAFPILFHLPRPVIASACGRPGCPALIVILVPFVPASTSVFVCLLAYRPFGDCVAVVISRVPSVTSGSFLVSRFQ